MLYGADDLRAADDVIVTEGEYDRLIVKQTCTGSNDSRMRQVAVVGLPGAGSWPPDVERFFTDAKRVYIGLDPDDTGRQYAAKLKAVVGSKARIVELPSAEPKCDWTDYLRPASPTNRHGGHGWGRDRFPANGSCASLLHRRLPSLVVVTPVLPLDGRKEPPLFFSADQFNSEWDIPLCGPRS